MQACVICEQYELGLSLYYDLGNDPSSSEWQWAGGYGTIHPLCRDLALRCMGMIRNPSSTSYTTNDNNAFTDGSHFDKVEKVVNGNSIADNSGYSDIMTNILKEIIEEDGVVSRNAIISLFRAYENDGEAERAIKLMHLLLSHRDGEMEWKIVGDSLEYFMTDSSTVAREEEKEEMNNNVHEISDSDLLNLVMDACNAGGEFGLSILLCRLGFSNDSSDFNFKFDTYDHDNNIGVSVKKLIESQPLLSENDEILGASMAALCGLGCPRDASMLHSTLFAKGELDGGSWDYSNQCLEYANSLGDGLEYSWSEAYRHMDRVIFAMKCTDMMKEPLSAEEEHLFSLAVAKMLQTSMGAGQIRAGIYLSKAAAATIVRSKQSSSKSIKETVQSFFGLKGSKGDTYTMRNEETLSMTNFLSCSDELLSATMEAYRELGELDDALMLFFNKWEGESDMRKSVRSAPYHPDPDLPDRKWIKSCDLALDILLEQNRFDYALAFFQAILPSYRSPHTYVIMAQGYAGEERWNDVARLYSDALKGGCLSDDLAILAMEGVAHGKINGKMRILRSIVDDIAPIKQIKPGAWIFNNYWILKQRLGFHHARLLMWWNDPATTQEQELRVAIQHLEESRRTRDTINPDVLTCIIKLAGHQHKKKHGVESTSEEAVASKNDAAELIVNAVLSSFEVNGQIDHPSMVSDGVAALRSLGTNRFCIDLVMVLIEQGFQLDKRILQIAQKAASLEKDEPALQLIDSLLIT